MNRTKIIRLIIGLCCIAGSIGYLVHSNYLLCGLLAIIAVVMIISAFK